jgi:hypothetical protein
MAYPDDYTTQKKKMVAEAERENARKEILNNERIMGRIPVSVSPEVEGAPKAGMTMTNSLVSEPRTPRAMVRGVPDEMTAEYRAPYKPPAAEPSESSRLAGMYADRMKKIRNDREQYIQDRQFAMASGAGLGAAVGGGLTGPAAPVGAVVGGLGGLAAGGLAYELKNSPYRLMREESANYRDIREGLRQGLFTQEELDAALMERGL